MLIYFCRAIVSQSLSWKSQNHKFHKILRIRQVITWLSILKTLEWRLIDKIAKIHNSKTNLQTKQIKVKPNNKSQQMSKLLMKAITIAQDLKMVKIHLELLQCKLEEVQTTTTITIHISIRTTNAGGRKIKDQTYITATT